MGILVPVSTFISKADLAARFALQFPFISVWPGIQHNITFLFYVYFCNIFMIIGLLDLFPSKDNSMEIESEKIRKSFGLLSEIKSSANSIAYVCSENQTFFWEAFLFDEFLLTAAHPILFPLFDPSV